MRSSFWTAAGLWLMLTVGAIAGIPLQPLDIQGTFPLSHAATRPPWQHVYRLDDYDRDPATAVPIEATDGRPLVMMNGFARLPVVICAPQAQPYVATLEVKGPNFLVHPGTKSDASLSFPLALRPSNDFNLVFWLRWYPQAWAVLIVLFLTTGGLALWILHKWSKMRTDLVVSQLQTATLVGRVIDGWQLMALIGTGAFANVYRCERLDRRGEVVAMKILKWEWLTQETSDTVRRFIREGLVQLVDKHVVQVLNCGEYDGRPYIVMDYIEGQTLRVLLNQRRLTPAEAVDYCRQMCQGLEAAHGRQIIHRDLKPENTMILLDGTLKLMDFGIAKHAAKPGVTQSDTTLGTPRYMSPEHVNAQNTEARSDIYSLGIVLFEMLTGRVPFDGNDVMETVFLHMTQDPPPMRDIDPSVPAELEPIVARMLAKKPEDRYQTVADVREALSALPLHTP